MADKHRSTTDLKKPLLKAVGTYLKEKRVLAGLTQQEIASLAKLSSPQFISNIERGVTLPPPDLMRTMRSLYKFNENELLSLLADLKTEYYRQLFFPKTSKKQG